MAPGIAGIRLFAGYSGWGPGQLEGELAAGAWYVVTADPADALTARPEALWRDVLRRQRGRLALLATYSAKRSLN
jgi:putative transcriptional regulator